MSNSDEVVVPSDDFGGNYDDEYDDEYDEEYEDGEAPVRRNSFVRFGIVLLVCAAIVGVLYYIRRRRNLVQQGSTDTAANDIGGDDEEEVTSREVGSQAEETRIVDWNYYVVDPNSNAGKVTLNSPCSQVDDCVPGSYCTAEGRCQAGDPVDITATCTKNIQCRIGMYCPAEVQLCKAGSGGVEDTVCEKDSDCILGLACQTVEGVTKLCTKLKPSGSTSGAAATLTPTNRMVMKRVVIMNGTKTMVRDTYDIDLITQSPWNLNYSATGSGWGYRFLPDSSGRTEWYGSRSPGAGLIPLYVWALNDATYINSTDPRKVVAWILSPYNKNTGPFPRFDVEFCKIGNNGNPVIYIWKEKDNDPNRLPLYITSDASDTSVHPMWSAVVNGRTLQHQDIQNRILYSGTTFDRRSNTGPVGYVYINP
jgi:hypothetical protein